MDRFVDEAVIHVASGHGGHGSVSFRREKYVPKGGPDGGDGGRGGDVVFVVQQNLKTLAHLRVKSRYHAADGDPGSKRNRHGSDGADAVIAVPPGTVVRRKDSGEVLFDLTAEGERIVFLRGGRGGKGNAHFATARHQTPRFAQEGEPGEEADLELEIQIIADIGFVGFPNAGKSSLLKAVTHANPRIGDYPFTTRSPNLGVIHRYEHDIILADMPGIIEGASDGAGLGFRFLRHISRTVGLAFVIDLSDGNPCETFEVLIGELEKYSASHGLDLGGKERIVIGSKLDLDGAGDNLDLLRSSFPAERVFGVSSFSRQGLDEIAAAFFELYQRGHAGRQETGSSAPPDDPGAGM